MYTYFFIWTNSKFLAEQMHKVLLTKGHLGDVRWIHLRVRETFCVRLSGTNLARRSFGLWCLWTCCSLRFKPPSFSWRQTLHLPYKRFSDRVQNCLKAQNMIFTWSALLVHDAKEPYFHKLYTHSHFIVTFEKATKTISGRCSDEELPTVSQ